MSSTSAASTRVPTRVGVCQGSKGRSRAVTARPHACGGVPIAVWLIKSEGSCAPGYVRSAPVLMPLGNPSACIFTCTVLAREDVWLAAPWEENHPNGAN